MRTDAATPDGLWSRDAASAALGMQLVEAAQGRAVVRMRVRPDMVNGHGTCHGGLVFSLADSAFALACNTGRATTVAAGADIVFVAPVRAGDLLEARAQERVLTGRSGVTDVTVRRVSEHGADAVVAEFRGRSRRIGDTGPASQTTQG